MQLLKCKLGKWMDNILYKLNIFSHLIQEYFCTEMKQLILIYTICYPAGQKLSIQTIVKYCVLCDSLTRCWLHRDLVIPYNIWNLVLYSLI